MPLQNPLSDHKKVSSHEPVTLSGARVQVNRASTSYAEGQTRDQHAEARQRVYRVLDALELVSRPFSRPIPKKGRIESYIDVMEPYPLQSWPLANHKLWAWYRPPNDAISMSAYAMKKKPQPRESHFHVQEEDVVGWVFPFVLGGRKPVAVKDLPHVSNLNSLIVPKRQGDEAWRSWMGGVQAYSLDGPTILEAPERIATGSSLSNPYEGGWHNDQAIEGMTAIDSRRSNPSEQVYRLWTIGNAVIERGKLAEVNFVDALSAADQEPKAPHLR
jgi:hypothetical protein